MSDSNPLDLDVLMERIRAELKKSGTSVMPPSTAARPTVPGPQMAEPNLRRYRFAEFKSLDNERFIQNAYLVALGRQPDEIGRFTMLHRLESGSLGRASLLRELMNSSEGRDHNAAISGLGVQLYVDRIRYNRLTRILPTVLRLVRNLPRIANHVRQLAAQAGTAERLALQAVASAEAAQRLAKSVESQLLEQRAWLERQIETVRRDLAVHLKSNAGREEVERLTEKVETELKNLASREPLAAEPAAPLVSIERLSAESQRMHADLQGTLAEYWRGLVDQKRRPDVPLKETRPSIPGPAWPDQVAALLGAEQRMLEAFYVSFEDRCRGTRADIKNRQQVYLADIKRAAAATGGAPVVDIACGRGEWLELLQENGFSAMGYDLNRMMVEESQQRGLDARLSDALQALAATPDASLAAVTGFRILEHLPFGTLLGLFDEAFRALRPGGLVIFETPNPGNLLIASERFYMDPTRRNPLPSELIAFMAETRGFTAVESRFLHPPTDRIAERFEQPLLELLRERIYAPQDYAVIGWKA